MYFRPQINSWIEEAILKRQKPQIQVYCEGGQIYENTRQGYKVCYPSGWYSQEFGYSQLMAGFDSSPIPQASEYAGMITVRVSRDASAALLAQYLAELENSTTAAISVDDVLGIKVMGTVPASSEFFPGYVQVYSVFEKFGRTYTAGFSSHPDSYEQNILLYEDFMEDFTFLDEVPLIPWSQDIFLDTPWPGDGVSGSFRVAGSAQGAFESTLVVRLKDDEGNVIFQESIIYNALEPGELGYFDEAFTFATSAQSGYLEVFYTSPKDGSVVDLVTVPLTFN